MTDEAWYEVWADESPEFPYILLLRPGAEGYEILDPIERYRQIFRADTYEEAKFWLLEDEYECVGRRNLES